MKTINHETYCGQDLIALLLKAGFDWKDYFVAHSIDEQFHWEIPLHIAQRWLREVKDIEVNVLCVYINNAKKYSYSVFEGKYNNELIEEGFDTYEEAQEAGIKKALEIILEKGKQEL